MIKAVIFDLGGTVVDWSDDITWRYIAGRFHLDYSYTKKRLDHFVTLREMNSIEEKRMWEIFFRSVHISLPKDYKVLMSHKFEKNAKLNNGVIKLIKQLKNKGYRIGLISNIESSHERTIRKRGLLKYFGVVVLSNKVKVRKPNKKIYKIALEKIKVKPEEAIFIDNLKENVIGARKAGMKSIWFKNAKQLGKDLKKYL